MKKIFTCLFIVVLGLAVISCGSTKTDPSEKDIDKKDAVEEIVEIVPDVVIQRFDDWEYKGFGKELPAWVDAAVDLDYAQLQQFYPGKDLLVIRGYGSNTDMCESASYQLSPYAEEAEFLDALWVRVNSEYEKMDKPYISIRVFNKLSLVSGEE